MSHFKEIIETFENLPLSRQRLLLSFLEEFYKSDNKGRRYWFLPYNEKLYDKLDILSLYPKDSFWSDVVITLSPTHYKRLRGIQNFQFKWAPTSMSIDKIIESRKVKAYEAAQRDGGLWYRQHKAVIKALLYHLYLIKPDELDGMFETLLVDILYF